MKPSMNEMRVRYAIDLLARELESDKSEIREALTNEALTYLGEEPESDLRLQDLE